MPRLRRITLLTLLVGGALLVAEAGSIVVAPTAVYIDHGTRASAVVLFNPGTEPQEITIEAVFGFPTTDESGALFLHMDEEKDHPRSAAAWLRAFPRQLVLGPGERRTVRLLGEPPEDLADGEYWARLVFTSRGMSIPMNANPGAPGVAVGLDLEVRTVIAATYRKGPVSTGLTVHGFAPTHEEESIRFRSRLERGGSAAWIGRLELELAAPEGQVVRRWEEQIAVYEHYDRAFAFPTEGVPPGRYQLRARFSTERDDVPEPFRLTTPEQRLTAEVEIR